MNPCFAFVIKSKTSDGHAIAAACICERYRLDESMEHISRISGFKCPAVKDPLYIDYILADYIKSISPPYIHAVGASINIPGLSESTGGIIGSPHKDINSAKGDIEYISEGLVLFSRPGGPGFIICGGEETARLIFAESQKVSDKQGKPVDALSILDSMKKNNINTGIIAADGSGPDREGCVIAYESGRSNIILTA